MPARAYTNTQGGFGYFFSYERAASRIRRLIVLRPTALFVTFLDTTGEHQKRTAVLVCRFLIVSMPKEGIVLYAASFARPARRRRAIMARPEALLVRFKKPWVRARFFVFGLYVNDMAILYSKYA